MCAEPVDETVRNEKYLLFFFPGILLKSLWPMTRLNYFSSKNNLKITASPTNRNWGKHSIDMKTNETNSQRETQLPLSPLGSLCWGSLSYLIIRKLYVWSNLALRNKNRAWHLYYNNKHQQHCSASVIWFVHYELNHPDISQIHKLYRQKVNLDNSYRLCRTHLKQPFRLWIVICYAPINFILLQPASFCIHCTSVLMCFIFKFIYSSCNWLVFCRVTFGLTVFRKAT